MATSFIHLRCHSNFSMLDGASAIDELVQKAAEYGMPALALTDSNNVCGAVEFYEKAKQKDIKPIIGTEITMDDESTLVLLAKNREGYNNLCLLLTRVHLRDGHNTFHCKNSDLTACKNGLLVLSGGKRGQISRLLKNRKKHEAVELCKFYRTELGDDFYLEMNHFEPDDHYLNAQLSEMSRQTGVPVVATNDIFFEKPSLQPVRSVLRAIKDITTVSKLKEHGSENQYFRSEEEMERIFGEYPEAIKNTSVIADKCTFEYSLGKPVFPSVSFSTGETGYSMLRKVTQKGLLLRYKKITKAVEDRFEFELDIIHKKGFCEYFLIVKDIVDYCKANDIPCVGRGSAGDSIICYALEITHADPIRFDLYFERFLNPERTKLPDIDLDICWKRRDDLLNHIYEKYGIEKTAMVCTYNTFQVRSSIREVGKAFGLPEDEVNVLNKNLSRDVADYLEYKYDKEKRVYDRIPANNPIYKKIYQVSKRISGFPRHLSIHCGGVIIAPDKITNYTALEVSSKGIVISQHDMHGIEKLGLVKMDILGLRGLSVIVDCMADVGLKGIHDFEEDDKKVMAMIMKGQGLGCFQLESPLVRGLLRKMQGNCLNDIVIVVALIRPGAAGDGGGMKDVFVRRRAGKEKVTYLHEKLEPILKNTYGIIVYQEQVLQIANAVAGLSYAEADILRDFVSKPDPSKDITPVYEKFIEGAKGNGIEKEKAVEIWHFLKNFVQFGFNKAHSVTYALLAYKSAFLKTYYPVQFMTAVLNNGGGFYGTGAYIEECRRMGIKIEPPDVNKAEILFTHDGRKIISGLFRVFNLCNKSMHKIVNERKESGVYENIYGFLTRTELMEREAVNLVKCGALRPLYNSEPEALGIVRAFFRNRRNVGITKRLVANLHLPPYCLPKRIGMELEILGYAVTGHPLCMFSETYFSEEITRSAELDSYKHEQPVTVIGWMITTRKAKTSTGEYIQFATLEDRAGLMEIVLFPDTQRKYAKIFRRPGPFKIYGKIQSRVPGEANIIAEKITLLHSSYLDKPEKLPLDKENDDNMFDAA